MSEQEQTQLQPINPELKQKHKHLSFIKITPLHSREELRELFSRYYKIEEDTYREEGRKNAPGVLFEDQEYQNLKKEYEEKSNAEREHALKQIREAVQKAWNGEFGDGEWALISGGDIRKFRKVIPISEWKKEEIDNKNEGGNLFRLEEWHLLNPMSIEEKIKKNKFTESEDFECYFLEVDTSRILSKEELINEYQKLFDSYAVKRRILSLNETFDVFPEDFIPTIRVGTVFKYGGCSHHSGEVDGYLIVLPSGSFAVFSEYSGEHEENFGEYNLFGVLKNPKTKPVWDAKDGWWYGEKLDTPTREDMAFLQYYMKGKKVFVMKEQMTTHKESKNGEHGSNKEIVKIKER